MLFINNLYNIINGMLITSNVTLCEIAIDYNNVISYKNSFLINLIIKIENSFIKTCPQIDSGFA